MTSVLRVGCSATELQGTRGELLCSYFVVVVVVVTAAFVNKYLSHFILQASDRCLNLSPWFDLLESLAMLMTIVLELQILTH